MFDVEGAVGTTIGWYAAGGSDEVWQACQSYSHAHPTILADATIETLGRLLSIFIAASVAFVSGGLAFDYITEQMWREGAVVWFWRAALVLWFVAAWGLFKWRKEVPSTTWRTRVAVAVAERLLGNPG